MAGLPESPLQMGKAKDQKISHSWCLRLSSVRKQVVKKPADAAIWRACRKG